MGHGTTSNRYFEPTKNGISAVQNPSQKGISRTSKSENGISYTGNIYLVINAQSFKKLIEGAVNLKGTDKELLMVKPEGIEGNGALECKIRKIYDNRKDSQP